MATDFPEVRTLRTLFLFLGAVASIAFASSIAGASDPPRVVITSRAANAGTTHVIGFLEGTGLKSAGIFDGDEKLKDIDVAGTPGSQRINFDFAIPAPSPGMTIAVTDLEGRSASARIFSAGDLGPSTEPPPIADDASGGPATGIAPEIGSGSSGNTAEIPRYGGSMGVTGEPHRRLPGGVGNRMGGVQLGIMAVYPVPSRPGSYEVVGNIAGAGVHRAGIYVNGRPVKPIPVAAGTFSPFDVVFPLTGGRYATIRAYGAGANYIETPIDLSGSAATYVNPYAPPTSRYIEPAMP
jgi:hypothetical protein